MKNRFATSVFICTHSEGQNTDLKDLDAFIDAFDFTTAKEQAKNPANHEKTA